jgi:hypothetical protein
MCLLPAGASLSRKRLGRKQEVNVAMQHPGRKECALCSAHSMAAERHKTAPLARRQALLPWIGAFAASAVILPFIGEWGGWLALGALVGLGAGAAIAWLNQHTHTHFAAATLAGATEELKAEADQRVAMVIRQFEWAVNDVANLRDALQRAQDGRAAAESSAQRLRRRLHMLERQLYDARTKIGEYSKALGSAETMVGEPSLVPMTEELLVPLLWQAYEENMLTWLRLESAGIIPSQVRILNEHDSVIAISARSLDTVAEGEQTSLILRAPDEVIAFLEGQPGESFRFEALVDEAWCRVELREVRKTSKDKRGRVWRPEDDHRGQALIA